MKTRRRSWTKAIANGLGAILGGGLALGAAACASGSSDVRPVTHVWSDEAEEPALLSASGAYELHVRDGRVVQVVPATEPGRAPSERVIDNYDELRRLYEGATGRPLPTEATPGVIQVNGWRGLECVRAAKACGPAPEVAPMSMVVLRFR